MSPHERALVRRRNSLRITESLSIPRAQRLELTTTQSVSNAVARLNGERGVLYAEPNYLYRLSGVPNDPSFGQQWGLDNQGRFLSGIQGTADADIDAPEAWDLTSGSRAVTVGIVDSGIRYDNRDLRSNIYTDHQGQHGYDWIDGGEPLDEDGHGTHVAGIIGAEADNAFGVSGVSPRVTLVALRVFGHNGLTTADAIAEAFFAAADRGARIVNASFGGPYSDLVGDAISLEPNTLFVAGAGNSRSDVDDGFSEEFPCNFTHANLICVTASDENDQLAHYANWGDASVDLAAPGDNVLSTHPQVETLFFDDFEMDIAGRWRVSADREATPFTRSTDVFRSPTHGLSDSPGGPYTGGGDSIGEIAQPFDLRDRKLCRIEFFARIAPAPVFDTLRVEDSSDGIGWSLIWGFDEPIRNNLGLALESYSPEYRLRFRFTKSGVFGNEGEGVDLDDVAVRCQPPAATASPDSLERISGTSMAAPHVSGVAALLFARYPQASVAQVKNALLDGVDQSPAFAGKTVSGGRLNSYKALTVPLREDPPRPQVGRIDTVAGGGVEGDGGPATSASLIRPSGVAALPDGGYLIADFENHRIRRVSSAGMITTVAGTGGMGSGGDNGSAVAAQLAWPADVETMPDGSFLIVDGNARVRRVSPSGTITTVAGTGELGYSGDGGPASQAKLGPISSVSASSDGGFLISDSSNGRVRKVSAGGAISTVAGPYCDYRGICDLGRVEATNDGGFLFVQEHTVKRSASGAVTTVAGNGKAGFSVEHGPATAARLDRPGGIAETPDGGFLLADSLNNRIRRVSPGGTITTIAGGPVWGFEGDGGPATAAKLRYPADIALTADGGFLIADMENSRIRFVASYPQGEPQPGSPPVVPPAPPPSHSESSTPAVSLNLPASPPRGLPGSKAPATASVRIRSGQTIRSALKRGLRATVSCAGACRFRARLLADRNTARKLKLRLKGGVPIGRRFGELASPGEVTIPITLPKKVRKALARLRSATLVLRTELTDPAGKLKTYSTSITLIRGS